MESCGELASPGLQPKLVPTQQVQHEEPEDIEDGTEKVFCNSKVHRDIIHNWVSFVEKPLFDGVNDLRR